MAEARWTAVIVDDLEDMRFLNRLVLRRGPFDVVGEGATGLDAIRLAREHKPDLMLLDLAMPQMDGLEALPLVLRESPRTRVVVLSGFDEDRVGPIAREQGAAAYLEKGIKPVALLEALHRVLAAPPA